MTVGRFLAGWFTWFSNIDFCTIYYCSQIFKAILFDNDSLSFCCTIDHFLFGEEALVTDRSHTVDASRALTP